MQIRRDLAAHNAVQARSNCNEHDQDKQVYRVGENGGRLGKAAQVEHGNQDHQQTGDRHIIRMQRRKGRGNGVRSRRNTDRYRQNIIDQKRSARQQSRIDPKVFLRYHVGSSTVRISENHLSVGKDERCQQHENSDGNGNGIPEGRRPDRHQHDEDLFGTIGDGRQGIRRKDRQRFRLGELLFSERRRFQRLADEHSFQQHKHNCNTS
ncbi:hypothetical protein D1872_243230 [compost metagenome]